MSAQTDALTLEGDTMTLLGKIGAVLLAVALQVPMTGSKWALYASGGLIKCGVTACGGKQTIGTLPNGEGVYFDLPVAADEPVGSYIVSTSFTGTGLNDVTWSQWPSITAPVTYCAVINGLDVYTDGVGGHDSLTWGTDPACTNGGTKMVQSTSGLWLTQEVVLYVGHFRGHTLGDKWTVTYGYGTAQTDWRGYLMTVPTTKTFTTAQSLTMRVQVLLTGAPVFGFHVDGATGCDGNAVAIRPHFQRGAWVKDPGDNYRWWAKGTYSIPLAGGGDTTLTVPLRPEAWVQTWGKTGSSTTALSTAFSATIANIGALGAAMGGGCSYGHGTNVSGGTARLVLKSYTIQ